MMLVNAYIMSLSKAYIMLRYYALIMDTLCSYGFSTIRQLLTSPHHRGTGTLACVPSLPGLSR